MVCAAVAAAFLQPAHHLGLLATSKAVRLKMIANWVEINSVTLAILNVARVCTKTPQPSNVAQADSIPSIRQSYQIDMRHFSSCAVYPASGMMASPAQPKLLIGYRAPFSSTLLSFGLSMTHTKCFADRSSMLGFVEPCFFDSPTTVDFKVKMSTKRKLQIGRALGLDTLLMKILVGQAAHR